MSDTLEVHVLEPASGTGNVTIMGNLIVINSIYGTLSGGGGATLDPLNPIEIGTGTTGVGGSDSISIGYNADAGVASAIAIGSFSYLGGSGAYGIAIGGGPSVGTASIAKGASSVSIGRLSNTSSLGGLSIGCQADCRKTRSVAIGYNATVNGGTGDSCIAIGRNSSVATNVTFGIAIGYNASASANRGIAIGHNSTASATYAIAIGSTCTSQGSGTTNLGRSQLNGQPDSFVVRIRQVSTGIYAAFTASGAGVRELITTSSSKLIKQDIRDIEDVGDKIDKIRIIRYRPDNYDDTGTSDRECIGILAEELEEIFPEFVGYDEDGVRPGTVSYAEISSILVKEIQTLRREIRNVKQRISVLKDKKNSVSSA